MSEMAMRAASRMESAAADTTRAADRMEEAASRMAHLFEDGYGGNGLRLIDLMEGSNELQATRDMLDSARSDLETIRTALGVPAEPHQSLLERMVEAAQAKRGAVPEGWHLDESEAALLHHLTSPDDDRVHPPITLRVGNVRMDDGVVKFGLLCEYTDYPDEGATLLVEGQPTVAAPTPAEVPMPDVFMYGVKEPDGGAWMQEVCVSTLKGDVDELVDDLNEGREDADTRYTSVSLVTMEDAERYGAACRAAGEAAGYARGLKDAGSVLGVERGILEAALHGEVKP